jgi:DNA-directed RNA polymerase specialized sigma24 family protein
MSIESDVIHRSEARLLTALGRHYIVLLRKDEPQLLAAIDAAILDLLAEKEIPHQEQLSLRADLDLVLARLQEPCRSILRSRYGLDGSIAEPAELSGSLRGRMREVPRRCLYLLSRYLLARSPEPVPSVADFAKTPGSRESAGQPAADLLGQLKSVVSATEDLRTASGRLSSRKVAEAFGLSVAELSRLIQRSRQAVSKTPDAESLQPALARFERIARLKAVLSESEFLRWLRMPNEQLDNRSPLDGLREGRADEIADFVEDMLTGNAT